MELNEKVNSIKYRQDLIAFISLLRLDLKNNKEKWGNRTLEDFLGAMEAWVDDMEGYYSNTNQPFPNQPSWKTIGEIPLRIKYV